MTCRHCGLHIAYGSATGWRHVGTGSAWCAPIEGAKRTLAEPLRR